MGARTAQHPITAMSVARRETSSRRRGSLLRRARVPAVIAAAAAALALTGCGYTDGSGGLMPSPVPLTNVRMVENSGWWTAPDGNFALDRICLDGRTAYLGENFPGKDSGGGSAYGPAGCTGGQNFQLIGGLRPVDQSGYNGIQAVCDRIDGTLIYATEMGDGGGIGSIPGGCARGAAQPGPIVPAGPPQQLGGPQDLSVRPFTDTGNGALLYVSESGADWGSGDNAGGGVSPVQHPVGRSGRIVQLTQWEGPIDTNVDPSSLADFCDMGNANLLVGSAIGDGGNAQALQGGCQAVADGQVPPTRYRGPSHYVPTSTWYTADGTNVMGGLLCGLNSGTTVDFTEANNQGGISLLRGNCVPAARGVGG